MVYTDFSYLLQLQVASPSPLLVVHLFDSLLNFLFDSYFDFDSLPVVVIVVLFLLYYSLPVFVFDDSSLYLHFNSLPIFVFDDSYLYLYFNSLPVLDFVGRYCFLYFDNYQ